MKNETFGGFPTLCFHQFGALFCVCIRSTFILKGTDMVKGLLHEWRLSCHCQLSVSKSIIVEDSYRVEAGFVSQSNKYFFFLAPSSSFINVHQKNCSQYSNSSLDSFSLVDTILELYDKYYLSFLMRAKVIFDSKFCQIRDIKWKFGTESQCLTITKNVAFNFFVIFYQLLSH